MDTSWVLICNPQMQLQSIKHTNSYGHWTLLEYALKSQNISFADFVEKILVLEQI
jgi:hypothetical protein